MQAENSSDFRQLYYLQFHFQRHAHPPWSLQVLKQKILHHGSLFDLTEAYGLNSSRTDDSTSQECVICLCNNKETIAKPCKHVSMCSGCAQVVFNSEKKCPVCRQTISEIIPFQVVTV
ncbi:hypothetical protein FGO68_gene16384 [Halteria grandinella]|uniref:RING-type domain-containing protein n=1 Tax=Halteria grandinella TaxID=5974 RepID=A0A8J8SUH8_HALGN|nr:hypothetical protein FGO68_gene16384 [Halteria grandinella]